MEKLKESKMFLTRDKEIAKLTNRLHDLENIVDKLKSRIVTLERDNSLVIYPNDVSIPSVYPYYEEVRMKSVVYGLLHHLGLQMKVSPAKDKEVCLLHNAVSNKGE
jgi:hypothetical protein